MSLTASTGLLPAPVGAAGLLSVATQDCLQYGGNGNG